MLGRVERPAGERPAVTNRSIATAGKPSRNNISHLKQETHTVWGAFATYRYRLMMSMT